MRFEVIGKTEEFILDLDSTHTSQGAANITHDVYSRLDKYDDGKAKLNGLKRYFRGDSGFCNREVFEACFSNQSKFVVTFRENMLKPLHGQFYNWKETNKQDDQRSRSNDGRECEFGETLYSPEGSDRVIRIVVIRAEIKNFGGPTFPDHKAHEYYTWCTNIGAGEMTTENVICFYRKRGHLENYIKELKYGFDLKHYPCQKLTANKAYGLIAAFAHVFTRYIAMKANKKNPHFAKKTRFKLISIPCEVVRHARNIVFKFMEHHAREVEEIIRKIKHQHRLVLEKLSPQVLQTDEGTQRDASRWDPHSLKTEYLFLTN